MLYVKDIYFAMPIEFGVIFAHARLLYDFTRYLPMPKGSVDFSPITLAAATFEHAALRFDLRF